MSEFLNGLSIKVYLIVASVLLTVITMLGGYIYYQGIVIDSKSSKILTLEKELEAEKENAATSIAKCKSELEAEKLNIKWKTKVQTIYKTLKKDTDEESKSDTKPANRFYLD